MTCTCAINQAITGDCPKHDQQPRAILEVRGDQAVDWAIHLAASLPADIGIGYNGSGAVVTKPMRTMIQFDVFAGQHGDCYSDGDGDGVFSGLTREPQLSGSDVRVLIQVGANPADVVRGLKKVLAWIERDGLTQWTEESNSECPF